MTAPRTFSPEAVEAFQPRARHFYHERGSWHAPSFMAWIDRAIIAFCAENNLPASQRLRGHQHDFDVWLAHRCPCTGGACRE